MSQPEYSLSQNGKMWTLEFLEDTRTLLDYGLWVEDMLKDVTMAEADTLIIDLTKAGVVDSRGLRLFLTIREMLDKEDISVILYNPHRQLKRMLEIMQMHRLFIIEINEVRSDGNPTGADGC